MMNSPLTLFHSKVITESFPGIERSKQVAFLSDPARREEAISRVLTRLYTNHQKYREAFNIARDRCVNRKSRQEFSTYQDFEGYVQSWERMLEEAKSANASVEPPCVGQPTLVDRVQEKTSAHPWSSRFREEREARTCADEPFKQRR